MSLPSLPAVRAWHRRFPTRATPLAAFHRLYGAETHAFLYESLEAHGQRGRYSFVGARPWAIFESRGRDVELRIGATVLRAAGEPLGLLRSLIPRQIDAPPIAPFCGGAVGYIGYDFIRQIEPALREPADSAELPDALLLLPREVICFDHLERLVHVILFQETAQEQRFAEIAAALAAAEGEEDAAGGPGTAAAGRIGSAVPAGPATLPPGLRPNLLRAQFEAAVARAQEYIRAGDVFQVVLSQRFDFEPKCPPLALYEALRETNPSPYMYYLRLGELHIAGSSPEVLASLTGRRAITRPLAGTRPRGATPAENLRLEEELRSDPKERAEHVMLVDLGRNDLGRVCEYGSVRATNVLDVEHHSRVMHLVSTVEGWLDARKDAIDLLASVFPAGTVSGAPKVRAMQIIDELEPTRRGVYAGAIGYFSLLGDMDLCIAIRTMVIHGGRGTIQAGAGVVADSSPAAEYQETLNKAAALFRAVAMAEERAGSDGSGRSAD